MSGKDFIDQTMQDVGRFQILTTDTNLRAIALAWTNRIIKDISARQPHWVWLEKTATFPTVASQLTYDLPMDIDLGGRKIFTIKQESTPATLTYVNQRIFDKLEADPSTNSGFPLYYTMFSTYLRLYPVPSSVITMYVRYLRTITALTDSASSTTDIPAKFDEVILDGMKIHAFRMFPNWGNVQLQTQAYENGIMRMIRDNSEELDSDDTSYAHSIEDPSIGKPYFWNGTGVT